MPSPRSSPSILIVGGRGKMGLKLSAAMIGQGLDVNVMEAGEFSGDKITAADVVILAVPMNVASEMAIKVGPFVRADALLSDINSLKQEICEVMIGNCAGEVLGTHPMFGPTVRNLTGQKIVVCPVRQGPRTVWLKNLFMTLGLEVVEAKPAYHDQMMAVVQVLIHFSKIVTAETLKNFGLSIEDTLPFMSPIYHLELAMTGRLFAQDPHLYAEIEMANPFGAQIRNDFAKSVQKISTILNSKDREKFADAFHAIHDYFHEYSEEAMKLSDHIVDSLVHKRTSERQKT